MDWIIATKIFAALFAIMNPLSCIPIVLAMTAGQSQAQQRNVILQMIITIAVGAALCALAGQKILSIFGIDVTHFQFAGGLIVLMIALDMLRGENSPTHAGSEQEQQAPKAGETIGIYPLGIPLTFGPGTIAAIIIIGQSAQGVSGEIGFYAGLIAYVICFSILLAASPFLSRGLSPSALSISKRIMGMILAAIAVEMMADATGTLFPALLRH
ncbi:MarC family protein [Pseudochelatococcus contaminans]|uniref:UPF0056 membrane protein n=1 Tax=Pseudochelatococcus contaminans TaxID=1538103 RepID=A0A7W5Z4W5_9HYPH|nr:multiple antibiotic resistance protein [Pseudochelatococcus contaminans]